MNNSTTYIASIEFSMFKDDYDQGELELVNHWSSTIEAANKTDLLAQVLAATNQDNRSDLDDEQINNYDFATEYNTSYVATLNDELPTQPEIEQWRKGNVKLYSVNCHILVTKKVEEKASL